MSDPLDPAQLFCTVYDEFTADVSATAVKRILARNQDRVKQWYDDVIHLEHVPTELAQFARGSEEAAFTLLAALDRVLGECHPMQWSDVKALSALKTRYIESGIFNEREKGGDDQGALLPRWVSPEQKESVADQFNYVIRVSEEDWKAVDYKHVHSGLENLPPGRFDPAAVLVDGLTRSRAIPVACAPFAEDPNEIVIDAVGDVEYALHPGPAAFPVDRMRKTLTNVLRSNAVIGLLPEACLDGKILDTWKVLLRESRGVKSPLLWLVVGSGPIDDSEPPRNEAVMLTREGEELLVQDKRHGYRIDIDTMRKWAMPTSVVQSTGSQDGKRFRDEHIYLGSKLSILETTVGRFAILICEDLGRLIDDGTLLQRWGISRVLTPVFDAELTKDRWEMYATLSLRQRIGSYVAVSNSLVVPKMRMRARKRDIKCAKGNRVNECAKLACKCMGRVNTCASYDVNNKISMKAARAAEDAPVIMLGPRAGAGRRRYT
ncbi:hypothetical protein [Streptomyces bugieae]|uniref:CN hydrolase domain-containing protein n=1 Tax=Streptomyces bugieae TaxID=3098223 RepID=A0ABU7NPU3_9ACTN|nr:hypothetical protein [Streptomyces sp. DSM 41528]